MKFLAILLLLQSSMAFAEKKITTKDFSVLGKIDEESIKNAEATKPAVDLTSSNSHLSMSCKDTAGKEYKKGDVGFETCLEGLKTQAQHGNKKDKKDGNSANFNFKIGD